MIISFYTNKDYFLEKISMKYNNFIKHHKEIYNVCRVIYGLILALITFLIGIFVSIFLYRMCSVYYYEIEFAAVIQIFFGVIITSLLCLKGIYKSFFSELDSGYKICNLSLKYRIICWIKYKNIHLDDIKIVYDISNTGNNLSYIDNKNNHNYILNKIYITDEIISDGNNFMVKKELVKEDVFYKLRDFFEENLLEKNIERKLPYQK